MAASLQMPPAFAASATSGPRPWAWPLVRPARASRPGDNREIPPPARDSPPALARPLEKARWRRAAALIAPPDNPSGAIYGLIVIGALLAAESGRHETYLESFASAAIAACLYWLAHAYATVLARRLSAGERLSLAVVARALAHDWPIMRGAAIPLLALLLAWIGGAGQQAAVNAAFWSVAGSLLALELAAGVRSRSRGRELALQAGIGMTLALGVIGLRVVLH
jgi:hypothetical protein